MQKIFGVSIMPRYTRRARARRSGTCKRGMARLITQAYTRRNPLWGLKYGPRQRHGGFVVVRKLPLMSVFSATGGIPGLTQLSDPTGSCITLGTPVASTGSSTAFDIPFTMKFSLNQLVNFTDITNIADQYKIASVLIRVSSAVQLNSNAQYQAPSIEYTQDYDDANPMTPSAFRQKMGVKHKYFGPARNMIRMAVRPKFADEIYNNGITTAYGLGSRREWLNCEYPGVEHYGIKGILRNVQLTGTQYAGTLTFDASVRVYAKDLQ